MLSREFGYRLQQFLNACPAATVVAIGAVLFIMHRTAVDRYWKACSQS